MMAQSQPSATKAPKQYTGQTYSKKELEQISGAVRGGGTVIPGTSTGGSKTVNIPAQPKQTPAATTKRQAGESGGGGSSGGTTAAGSVTKTYTGQQLSPQEQADISKSVSQLTQQRQAQQQQTIQATQQQQQAQAIQAAAAQASQRSPVAQYAAQQAAYPTSQPSGQVTTVYTGQQVPITEMKSTVFNYPSPLGETASFGKPVNVITPEDYGTAASTFSPSQAVTQSFRRQGIISTKYMNDVRVAQQVTEVASRAKELQRVAEHPENYTTEDGKPITPEFIDAMKNRLDYDITQLENLERLVPAERRADADIERAKSDALFAIPFVAGNVMSTLVRSGGDALLGAVSMGNTPVAKRLQAWAGAKENPQETSIDDVLRANLISIYEHPESATTLEGITGEFVQSPVGSAIISIGAGGALGVGSGLLTSVGQVAKRSAVKTAIKYGVTGGLAGLYGVEKGQEVIGLYAEGKPTQARGALISGLIDFGVGIGAYKAAKALTLPKTDVTLSFSKTAAAETEPVRVGENIDASLGKSRTRFMVQAESRQPLKKTLTTTQRGVLDLESTTQYNPETNRGLRVASGEAKVSGTKKTFKVAAVSPFEKVNEPEPSVTLGLPGDKEVVTFGTDLYKGKSWAGVSSTKGKQLANQYSEFTGRVTKKYPVPTKVSYVPNAAGTLEAVSEEPLVKEFITSETFGKSITSNANKPWTFGLSGGKAITAVIRRGGNVISNVEEDIPSAPQPAGSSASLFKALSAGSPVVNDVFKVDKALTAAITTPSYKGTLGFTMIPRNVVQTAGNVMDALSGTPTGAAVDLGMGMFQEPVEKSRFGDFTGNQFNAFATTTSQTGATKTGQQNILRARSGQGQRGESGVNLDLGTEDRTQQGSRNEQEQGSQQQQRQQTMLKNMLQLKTGYTTPQVPVIVPVTTTTTFEFPNLPGKKHVTKSVLGYDIFVKKRQRKISKGKYRSRGYERIGTGLTESSALGLGAELTGRTIARSFIIKPSKKEGTSVPRLEKSWKAKRGQFYAGKSGQLIERTNYAIDTLGERNALISARVSSGGHKIPSKRNSVLDFRSVLALTAN